MLPSPAKHAKSFSSSCPSVRFGGINMPCGWVTFLISLASLHVCPMRRSKRNRIAPHLSNPKLRGPWHVLSFLIRRLRCLAVRSSTHGSQPFSDVTATANAAGLSVAGSTCDVASNVSPSQTTKHQLVSSHRVLRVRPRRGHRQRGKSEADGDREQETGATNQV